MQNQHVAEPFRGILNRHAYSQLAAIALCDTLEVVRVPEQRSVIEEFIALIRADRGDCDSAVDPNEDNSGLEPVVDLTCQNCMEAPGVLYDQDFPVSGGKPGWVCQRCHDLCSDCGNHPTEGHRASCRFNGGDV